MNFQRRTYPQVFVLGAGESGTGAALLAAKNGLEVFVSDSGKIRDTYRILLQQTNIPFEENGHNLKHLAPSASL